jgi:hypothetical protein
VEPIAGSPLKRQRRLGLRDADDVAFLRLLVTREPGLSNAQWRALSPGEKLERLFGCRSIEQMGSHY